MYNSIPSVYRECCQKAAARLFCRPGRPEFAQLAMFCLGIVVVNFGLVDGAEARNIKYNQQRIAESVNAILTYLEGTVGALVMVSCGIGAIMSSAFGQYRASLGLMVVAVGAFILRSLMSTFFNDVEIMT